ncbi:hypothetical protein SDC9_208542 [bioreactor metagenome]|uniref:Uncharacterized protein n=1 Tax=bioreactor metagenome TaxID=1076179 RepID=A0A645JCM1_9ZZZZ
MKPLPRGSFAEDGGGQLVGFSQVLCVLADGRYRVGRMNAAVNAGKLQKCLRQRPHVGAMDAWVKDVALQLASAEDRAAGHVIGRQEQCPLRANGIQ